MYTYITSGTHRFLKKLVEKHPNEKMVLMHNIQTSMLWHETDGPTVFQSPRRYEVIHSVGGFAEKGYIACNHIPVEDEARPVFEFELANQAKQIESRRGFKALRMLRPLKSDTYIVMTMWEDEKAFEAWKNSQAFMEAHEKAKASRPKADVFSGPSYVSTFFTGDPEDEGDE